jgi:hypothetical protein
MSRESGNGGLSIGLIADGDDLSVCLDLQATDG